MIKYFGREGREPAVVQVSGDPVLVKESDLQFLHQRLVQQAGQLRPLPPPLQEGKEKEKK